jgi:hypothetical protein
MKATKILVLFLVFFFVACGYKPSAKFARSSIGEKVSTFVVISQEDPQNSVLVKDAIDLAIIDSFHSSLTDKSKSDSHLVITVSNPSYSPVQYDENGFVTAYRMKITLGIKRYKNGEVKSYTTTGYYDFAVDPKAVIITDQQRFNAIRYAAQKAIVAFISQISAEGARS